METKMMMTMEDGVDSLVPTVTKSETDEEMLLEDTTTSDDDDDVEDTEQMSVASGGEVLAMDTAEEEEEDEVLEVKETSDGLLACLPSGVLRLVGSFLPLNDMTNVSLTSNAMYKERMEYSHRKDDGIFHLVLEERLPLERDFKSTLQPYRFLFQSQKYGIIQVDFSEVNPHIPQHNNPILRHFYPRRNRNRRFLSQPWEDVLMRVNIQKKFPKEEGDFHSKSELTTAKVIFRLDQSLPGCSFHFESKYIVGWGPGELTYLVHRCVSRLPALYKPEEEVMDEKQFEHPTTDDLLMKFQGSMKEHSLRYVKNKDA